MSNESKGSKLPYMMVIVSHFSRIWDVLTSICNSCAWRRTSYRNPAIIWAVVFYHDTHYVLTKSVTLSTALRFSYYNHVTYINWASFREPYTRVHIIFLTTNKCYQFRTTKIPGTLRFLEISVATLANFESVLPLVCTNETWIHF